MPNRTEFRNGSPWSPFRWNGPVIVAEGAAFRRIKGPSVFVSTQHKDFLWVAMWLYYSADNHIQVNAVL